MKKNQLLSEKPISICFASAGTSSQFNTFVHKYTGNDPDNLVPQAILRRNELRLKEASVEALKRTMQAKIQKEQQEHEQDQMRQKLAKVESFRRSIKVETETNCGPVLEIKGSLIKIYSPVENYGTEHWIKKGLLFPAEYGCKLSSMKDLMSNHYFIQDVARANNVKNSIRFSSQSTPTQIRMIRDYVEKTQSDQLLTQRIYLID